MKHREIVGWALVIAIAFGLPAAATYVTEPTEVLTLAASNTVTYSGSLNKGNPSRVYAISAGAGGSLIASHNSNDANVRVSILDASGNLLAESTGSSASVSALVTPGDFSIRIDYTAKLKGVKKYQVSITYPVADPVTTTTTTPPPTTTTPPPTTTTTTPTPTTTPPPTGPDLIWHADADTDSIVSQPSSSNTGETVYWDRMEQSNLVGRLTIVDDPLGLYGKVYKAQLTPSDISAGLKRAEWAQMKDEDGTRIKLYENGTKDVYFGWRAFFGSSDNLYLGGNENDGNYMQLKGDSSCGGPAIGLTIRNNRLAVRTIDGAHIAMEGPLMTSLLDNEWHTVVLHVNLAKDSTGFISVWLDGVAQTMTNGQTQVNVPTVCPSDTYVYPKLGVYGMDTGIGTGPQQLIESPRIGTTLESVVPR